MLARYDGAKRMLAFVDSEAELGRLVREDADNFEGIGRALVAARPDMVDLNGSPPQAIHLAQIGFQFVRQHVEASGFVADIDGAADKSPEAVGGLQVRKIEKMVLLQTLDTLWREHLVTLEHLRQVIHFRGYGQRDPLNEYKSEGFHLFEAMLANLRQAVTHDLMHIRSMPVEEEGEAPPAMQPVELPPMQAHHVDPFTGEDELAMADAALAAASRPAAREAERRAPVQKRRAADEVDPKDPATWGKVSRNAACPCGSGKKYKHCHGKHD